MPRISGQTERRCRQWQTGLPLVSTILLIACQGDSVPRADEASSAASSGPISTSAEPDLVQAPQPPTLAPVGRAEILGAVAAAADAVAAGRPLPKVNSELTNRAFEVRLPFGCAGENAANPGNWSFDPQSRVLRISVPPRRWRDDPVIKNLARDLSFEAVEGFWIERPWTTSENCPPPTPAPAPAPKIQASAQEGAPPRQTLAIAQFFEPGTRRSLQRGNRPYSYIGKRPENQAVGAQGFHLKLSGRVSGFADGQPIHCAATSPSLQPLCVLAVEFAEVAFEEPGASDPVAQWKN